MADTLKHARCNIANSGGSELDALEDQPAAKEMWEQIQKLKLEKYNAVKKAAADAAAPFDTQIKDLEEQYALLLRLAL